MTGSASKQTSLAEAAASVPDGATIALGGLSMNSAPMAFVRELVRADKRDLTVVAIVAGMCVDWLVAAGAVSRVVAGLVSFEGLGLAPHFRRAVERGETTMEEYSEHLLICRLQAQARRLPFMPTVAGLGTDVPALHAGSGTLRIETDTATGRPYVACTPLAVDVAVVHVHEADATGNARVHPKLIWMDSEIVNAADRSVVTAERIVDNASFTAEPHRSSYPRFMVDAVCAAPRGAYPTSCFPDYGHDDGFYADYVAACGSPADFGAFWERRIAGPETWDDVLAANGAAVTDGRIAGGST
ncbi:MAG: hypothetical protein OXH20_06635 [bacterium]|nr:hypothetical protein [bacterium]